MEILIKIAQLLLSLSILVIIHEFGHYLPARLFKTRIEKFYLFFNPWFSLFRFRRGETEYGVGWLPLGGYVKISGMIDESIDREQMKKEPQPYEFRSKPTWQRLIILLGGVTMNVFLAIFIYIILLASYGEKYIPNNSLKYGIACDSIAFDFGLKNGDKILKVDDEEVDDFFDITAKIILDNASTIIVNRDDSVITINIPDGAIVNLIRSQSIGFISPRIPFIIGGFVENSPAKEAGIKVSDRIIGINAQEYLYFNEFRSAIQKHKSQIVDIMVLRNNDTLIVPVNVNEEGFIGVIPVQGMDYFFDIKTREYNIVQAMPAGVVKTYTTTVNYFKQIKLIFSPKTKAYESLGGFITIGKIFPAQWNWVAFWSLTAFISIILAVLNILPIPALDGGHIMFVLYEIITRRKPSDKFIEYAQITGMVILFSLVLYANGLDVLRLFR